MPTPDRVRDLVAHVERGQIFEALDAFYAADVVMQENTQPPTVGKSANVERERAFLAGIARLDRYHATAILVDGERAVINWVADFVGTDGRHYHFDQLALQTWRGEGDAARIVQERFVYDSASIVAAAHPDVSASGRVA